MRRSSNKDLETISNAIQIFVDSNLEKFADSITPDVINKLSKIELPETEHNANLLSTL